MTHNHQSGSALITGTIIAVIALVGLGIAYYFTDGFGTNAAEKAETARVEADTKNESKTDSQVAESATGQDTLPMVKAAFAGEGSIKCMADNKYEGKYSIATISIKDKNHYRLDVRTDMGTAHMIILNEKTNYTWMEGQKQGTLMTLSKDDRTIDQQWQDDYVDYAKDDANKVNGERPRLSCERTALADSLFVAPKGIKFADMSPYTVD